jgi:hypothetical protein
MMKRSFFLALAAGLLASLSLTAPSHAGSTTVTTNTNFSILAPSGTTVTDLEVSYTPSVDPISDLTIVSSTGLSNVSIAEASNTVTVSFNATTSGSVIFTFETAAAAGTIGSTTVAPAFSGASSTIQNATTSLNVSSTAGVVPEPGSMALLGIGMTGFLAFRRLFKRHAIA